MKKTGLGVFDGEVVMSFALPDHIAGNLALVQQRIRGNIFTFNVDGIQQWLAVLISLVRLSCWSDTGRLPNAFAPAGNDRGFTPLVDFTKTLTPFMVDNIRES